MTEQKKTGEIAEINQQLTALRAKIDEARSETRSCIENRDKLNEQFKKLRKEIRELKNERDNMNEKVKNLKRQRDEAHTKIRANIEEVKAQNQKITELKKKTPRTSRQTLQKEFADLEWKIQTTSLDMQEEKRLIESVKQLETYLNTYKKIDQHAKRITTLRKELKTLEATTESAHAELTEMAERSQKIHAKMMAKINVSKTIKSEADSLHSACGQAKERVKPLHEEFKRLTEHRKKLQDAVREEDEKRKKNAEEALKEKLEYMARKKLQRGEKLSWDEFKLLVDDESEDV